VVQRIVDEGAVVYGINTGFASWRKRGFRMNGSPNCSASGVIAQRGNRDRAVGRRGAHDSRDQGGQSGARHSGVRPELIDALLTLANRNVTPRIPAKGSVGASGDLAPLAHMSMVLIGEGEAIVDGEVVSGRKACAAPG